MEIVIDLDPTKTQCVKYKSLFIIENLYVVAFVIANVLLFFDQAMLRPKALCETTKQDGSKRFTYEKSH